MKPEKDAEKAEEKPPERTVARAWPQRAGALCDQPRSMMSATPARTQRAGGDFVLSCAWKT